MDSTRLYRGLLVTLVFVVAGFLAFFGLPRPAARYVVPACFVLAACGLVVFYRDFLHALRR